MANIFYLELYLEVWNPYQSPFYFLKIWTKRFQFIFKQKSVQSDLRWSNKTQKKWKHVKQRSLTVRLGHFCYVYDKSISWDCDISNEKKNQKLKLHLTHARSSNPIEITDKSWLHLVTDLDWQFEIKDEIWKRSFELWTSEHKLCCILCIYILCKRCKLEVGPNIEGYVNMNSDVSHSTGAVYHSLRST